jgi:hypothetical protein
MMFMARGENELLELTGTSRRWQVLIEFNRLADLSMKANVMPGEMSRDRGKQHRRPVCDIAVEEE